MKHHSFYKKKYQPHVRDEQLQTIIAFLIAIFSVLIFTASVLGYFSEITYGYKNFLVNSFGRYNKWSDIYGPAWLVILMSDFSSFGSGPTILLFLLLISIYMYQKSYQQILKPYLLVIIGGGIFSLIVKTIFAKNPTFNFIKLFLVNENAFPSGHAMVSVIFYLTSAYFFSRRERNRNIILLFYSVGFILPLIIGISRIFLGAHSPNQVIAGWAIGYFWVSVCWLIGNRKKKIFF